MNITLEKIDAVTGLITVEMEKADYAERVTKALKDFRKKANMPGFRPGQAPMGMLKQRFGEGITVEEVNKLLSEKLYGYIREQKLNVLGEPLPNADKQMDIDFKTMDHFSFTFDVAFAPEFDAKLSADDTIDFYHITVDDAMVEKQVSMEASRAGDYAKVDTYEDKDMVKGTLTELTADGQPLEGGIAVEGAVMLPQYMKDDEEKARFVGAKVGDVLTFNPSKAYNSDVELSSLLKITKEEAAEKKSDFQLQIAEITRFTPAPIDQKLFDRVLGEGKAKSEEEFREATRQTLSRQFESDSEFKFMLDLRAYLIGRIGQLTYPEAMLKRVALLGNKDLTEEKLGETFPQQLEALTWQLAKDQLTEQFGIKLEQADVMATAKQMTRLQFAQYGMANVPDEALTQYAGEMLKDKHQAEGIVERTLETKIAAAAKALVKLNEKEVSLDEFNKMFK